MNHCLRLQAGRPFGITLSGHDTYFASLARAVAGKQTTRTGNWSFRYSMLIETFLMATSKATTDRVSRRRCLFRVVRIYCCITILLLPWVCQGAHSRKRIVNTREREVYDRVITEFSPEGRLSQVEYGMEASRRGSTVAAAVTDTGLCLVIENSSFGKMHRIDHHIWIATAGLSGDSRFLANHLRTRCQQHRIDYGEEPTTKEVAEMAGQFQHYLTRSGGIRPLGCTALIVGVDPVAEGGADVPGRPKLYLADPGGIVQACDSFTVAGKGSDAIAKDLSAISDYKRSTDFGGLAYKVAHIVIAQLEGSKSSADVWMLEPHRGKRGCMRATCYQRLAKDSLSILKAHESDQQ